MPRKSHRLWEGLLKRYKYAVENYFNIGIMPGLHETALKKGEESHPWGIVYFLEPKNRRQYQSAQGLLVD